MSDEEASRHKGALLIGVHGDVENQKNALVDRIIDTFGIPDRWPLTDVERIELLKDLFRMAQTIKETEST